MTDSECVSHCACSVCSNMCCSFPARSAAVSADLAAARASRHTSSVELKESDMICLFGERLAHDL